MNFPQVHGARIAAAPDPELVAAEARLAALDDDQVVAVDPVWVESVVEKVAAGRVPVQKGRLRRIAAAAVAFFALHGVATAATVTAVTAATVTAVVLWPARHNSSETMTFAEALELLSSEGHDEQPRASALIQVVRRLRAVVDALHALARDPECSPAARTAAINGLKELSEALVKREPPQGGASSVDPLPTALYLLKECDPKRADEESVGLCLSGARMAMQHLVAMPTNPRLDQDRELYLARLLKLATR